MKKIQTPLPTTSNFLEEINLILSRKVFFDIGTDEKGNPKHKWNQNFNFMKMLQAAYIVRGNAILAMGIESYFERLKIRKRILILYFLAELLQTLGINRYGNNTKLTSKQTLNKIDISKKSPFTSATEFSDSKRTILLIVFTHLRV